MTGEEQRVTEFSRMNVVDAIVFFSGVIQDLQNNGIIVLREDGHYEFGVPNSTQILAEFSLVEERLKSHGVTIPENVQRVLQALTLVLPLVLR